MSEWNTSVGLVLIMAGVADIVAAGHKERRVVDNEKPMKNWSAKIPMREKGNILSQTSLHISFNNLRNQGRIGNDFLNNLAQTWWWILSSSSVFFSRM